MPVFTLRYEDRRPYMIAVVAPDLDQAQVRAKEQLDTARERYTDGEGYRVLARHTCVTGIQSENQVSNRYVLEFTEKRTVRVTVDAADPAEAEEEVREHWDFYASDAEHSGGYVLTLRSAEPESIREARRIDPGEAPF